MNVLSGQSVPPFSLMRNKLPSRYRWLPHTSDARSADTTTSYSSTRVISTTEGGERKHRKKSVAHARRTAVTVP